ncbi:hypothetical protein ACIBAI_26605 [Streptomyces sp. NPDC051041]|uniref:hypothetical protein n=1 Tax=Streptomyces sp. NPDC051041 TaxID=3365640 RepID=UPI0037AF2675
MPKVLAACERLVDAGVAVLLREEDGAAEAVADLMGKPVSGDSARELAAESAALPGPTRILQTVESLIG